jgi:hypothetical protein
LFSKKEENRIQNALTELEEKYLQIRVNIKGMDRTRIQRRALE